eukprot:TRINITY_DN11085_c0_g1_i1.p1 TRINITY_DN11085_c0_g1~~TRINITY_DN11085_c0_g1_i1.p1  ORF type:complete len:221 (-),score=40.07 TRINITY_DN11085_c0_g1_i1:82-744(-)
MVSPRNNTIHVQKASCMKSCVVCSDVSLISSMTRCSKCLVWLCGDSECASVHPCGEQHSMIAPVQEGLVDVEPCKKLPLKTPTDIQKCPVGRCCVTCGDLDNLSNLVRCTICDGWACPEDSCSWNHKCRKCLNEHKDRPSSPKASTNSEVTNTESITVQKQPEEPSRPTWQNAPSTRVCPGCNDICTCSSEMRRCTHCGAYVCLECSQRSWNCPSCKEKM